MNKKSYVYLGIVLILAAFMRLWQIGEVPRGVSNDEAAYGFASLGIGSTLSGLDGKLLPLSFNFDNSFAPVHAYISAPFVTILGLSPFSLRLPFALLGIGAVLLLFLLIRKLFQDDELACLSAFVLAVSPWHTHMTRIVYDGPITFFSLLWIFLFVSSVQKGKAWFSLPAFFLAYYSYHATKIFLVPFFFLLLFLYAKDLMKHKKDALVYISGIFLILISFFFVLRADSVTRQNVFIWNHSEDASKMVDWERDKSLAPFFIRSVFSNKVLYYVRVFRERYLEAFSMQYLFLHGETSGLGGLYGVFYRGQMYFFELPLLAYGLYALAKKKRSKEKYLVFGGLLLAPLPSSLAFDSSYALRSIMMVPFLSFFVAFGVSQIIKNASFSSLWFKRFVIGIIGCLYAFFVVFYLYQYHFRYPVYAGESWFQSSKDLSIKIEALKSTYDHVEVAEAGGMFVFQYGLYNKKSYSPIRTLWNMNYPKDIENIIFLPECKKFISTGISKEEFLPHTVYIVPERCHKNIKPDETIVDIGEPIRVIWKFYDIDKQN